MKPRPSQLQTLAAINSLPDGAMVSDVSARLDISLQAAEKRIDRLAEKGLVEDNQIRWPHSRDGWITLAVLSDEGRKWLEGEQ